jgi:putative ABC transport system substrate-binding protein
VILAKPRRRLVLATLAAGAGGMMSALVPAARAQQALVKQATMVVLFPGDSDDDEPATRHFFEELRRRGWIEGSTIAYERLSGRGTRRYLESMATLAAGRTPSLVLATTASLAKAVVADGSAVPVVFITGADPVTLGLVESHARPGRNATGVHQIQPGDLVHKTLEIMRDTEAGFKRIGVLFDRHSPEFERQKQAWNDAAGQLGIELQGADFTNFEAVHKLLVKFRKDNISVVAVTASLAMLARRKELIAAALRNRIAIIGRRSEWPETGGLLSYGIEIAETQRRAAAIADRILKGRKAAEIPVERTMKIELVLNTRTAKTLGFGFPKALLLRADRILDV